MNGNNNNNNIMCNQISKNLPLKKRRTYFIEPSITTNNEQNENYSTTIKDDPVLSTSTIAPTPPSSPHIDLLRQQYAYLLTNSTNYLHLPAYDCFVAQKILTQQFLDNYQKLIEQQQQQQCGYTIVEDKQNRTDITIDEHFRKSLGDNYNKCTDRCLTPDDSSSSSLSNSSSTPVDSIEEHFTRSLAKFRSLNQNQIIESNVDDHFAKALGSTIWEKLKEKS